MKPTPSSAIPEARPLAFGVEDLAQASDNPEIIHKKIDPHAAGAGEAISLFTWPEIKSLSRTDANHAKHWRFYRDGHQIDAALMGLLDKDGMLRSGQLDQLLEQGMSVMINRLELKLPRIAEVSRNLESLTGAYVRVVAIGSPGSAPAMPLHYDHVDVIAMQTAGKKKWLLFGPPVAGCGVARERDSKPQEVTDQAELEVGHQLFIPAGIHHQCLPSDGSLHLAFNLKWPTFLDIDPGLTDRSKNDERLLDPIRTFRQADRIALIAETLDQVGSQAMEPDQLARFFEDWPSLCKEKWRVSDLSGYF